MFNSPDRYGKGLDWAGYTVHDASNVLRRYLNQLPEPIVPLAFYNTFRDPLRTRQGQAVGDMEAQSQEPGDVDLDKTIGIFQRLITELPPLNRQLLLYILDLLAVFASKSDVNLMNSANLAAIFQPGVLSHPTHDMNPPEYRLSQDVLIFLIDNQDSFLIGMSGTAADKSTIQEVQSGPQPPRQSYTPQKLAQVALGRSASNASAGTESVRKYGDIRRNLSVSSKNSKKSTSPGTPSSGAFAIVTTGSGVYRSNTVPSKKSPGLSSGKFSRGLDSPNTPIALSPALLSPGARSSSPGSKAATMASESRDLSHSASTTPTVEHQPIGTGLMPAANAPHQSKERLLPGNDQQSVLNTESSAQIDATPPPKVRKVSGLLTKTPTNDGKEPRQPNKLKKKRIPSSAHPSANSSTHSLPTAGDSPSTAAFFTPLVTPGIGQTAQTDPLASLPPIFSNTAATPQSEKGPILGDTPFEPKRPTELEPTQQPSDSTLKPKSPAASVNSKSSINDLSEHDHNDEAKKEKHEKRGLFRFSMPGKKNGHATSTVPSSDKRVGSNVVAEASSSSIGSVHVDRKSMSNDIPRTSIDAVPPVPRSALGFEDKAQEEKDDSQKKGLFNRLKTKVAQAREDRKERDIEKERAKSPPREEERSGSKHSLSAIALPSRGRSLDVNVEQQGPPLILETEAAPVPSGQSTHL